MGTFILIIILALIAMWAGPFILAGAIIIVVPCLIYWIYQLMYFHSEKFNSIKNRIQTHINECNELNNHIEGLKNTYINLELGKVDYGEAQFNDTSYYNYKRPELRKAKNDSNVYMCSRSVVGNAEQQPFKYVCKYFNIKATNKTIEGFEEILNNFSAAENGKTLLIEEKDEIIKSIESEIPFLIRKFSKKKLESKLGFEEIDLSDTYFPKFSFQYVSPGGNAEYSTDVVMNPDNLERFIKYLADQAAFRNSVQGQRQLMTKALREYIKERDGYTCQYCGVSTFDEPHLLLEIDHIKPLSKGGMTEESNLQTLCWKCNRSKSNKY